MRAVATLQTFEEVPCEEHEGSEVRNHLHFCLRANTTESITKHWTYNRWMTVCYRSFWLQEEQSDSGMVLPSEELKHLTWNKDTEGRKLSRWWPLTLYIKYVIYQDCEEQTPEKPLLVKSILLLISFTVLSSVSSSTVPTMVVFVCFLFSGSSPSLSATRCPARAVMPKVSMATGRPSCRVTGILTRGAPLLLTTTLPSSTRLSELVWRFDNFAQRFSAFFRICLLYLIISASLLRITFYHFPH